MKITKLIALISFISVFAISCSNDDNSIINETEQKEINAKFLTIGIYEFGHAGAAVPFEFTETTFGIGSPMPGQGFEVANLIKLYENNNSGGLYRAVLKTKSGRYSALFMRNIKGNEMEINIDNASDGNNFDSEEKAIEAPYPNPDARMTNHDAGQFGWIKIIKRNDNSGPEPTTDITVENLSGNFQSVVINNIARYKFQIGENDEAFIFIADMQRTGTFSDYAGLKLAREFTDVTKGQIIYKITDSFGYYEGRTDQYLTLYVRKIAEDGNSADFAIATKDGTQSISGSKGDVIGKTLEEAKAIEPPDDEAIWGIDMMNYAHVWINATKQ